MIPYLRDGYLPEDASAKRIVAEAATYTMADGILHYEC